MKLFLLYLSLSLSLTVTAQSFLSADTVHPPADFENIYSRPLYSDSLVSSFVIFIKKEVRLHKHISHSEHVIVLEGEGEMTLGEKHFKIKKDDVVFIPKGTPHSLKTSSTTPIKVISVQSPLFDGKDRIMME